MFNGISLATGADPELNKKYAQSVQLALQFCEHMPGQFKLVETPINSFVLVSNVMPEDERPWTSNNSANFDFSNIQLPKLDRLAELCEYEINNDMSKQKHLSSNMTNFKGESKNAPTHYIVYDNDSWKMALRFNKTNLINEAISLLAYPQNWKGLLPQDPLPYIWTLFHGKKSFCKCDECLYKIKFGQPGPILFPPHIYTPTKDILSFIGHVCKYFKFLYGGLQMNNIVDEESLPFDTQRLKNALASLDLISDNCTYVSQTCLLCRLYQQNKTTVQGFYDSDGCIILGGLGKKYINCSISTKRCFQTGDTLFSTSYNIPLLLKDIEADDFI